MKKRHVLGRMDGPVRLIHSAFLIAAGITYVGNSAVSIGTATLIKKQEIQKATASSVSLTITTGQRGKITTAKMMTVPYTLELRNIAITKITIAMGLLMKAAPQ